MKILLASSYQFLYCFNLICWVMHLFSFSLLSPFYPTKFQTIHNLLFQEYLSYPEKMILDSISSCCLLKISSIMNSMHKVWLGMEMGQRWVWALRPLRTIWNEIFFSLTWKGIKNMYVFLQDSTHTQITRPQLFTSSINTFLCPMLPENRTFPEPDENFSDGTMYFFGYLV